MKIYRSWVITLLEICPLLFEIETWALLSSLFMQKYFTSLSHFDPNLMTIFFYSFLFSHLSVDKKNETEFVF